MATATQVANFINMMAPIAIRQAKKHDNKIFASVCIAQACQETGFGTSAKMVRANAVFGVKVGKSAYHFGSAWKGKAYKTGTTEYYDGKTATKIVDWFRAYDTIEDATEDYFDMLCHCSRYKPSLNRKTPKECIEAIVSGGYATGPQYAKHITTLIKTYGLEKYDGKDLPESNPYKLATSIMKVGSRGESVKWLQWELNKRGANLIVDGIYGTKTKLSVLLFQKDRGLVQDGICGPVTLMHLKST